MSKLATSAPATPAEKPSPQPRGLSRQNSAATIDWGIYFSDPNLTFDSSSVSEVEDDDDDEEMDLNEFLRMEELRRDSSTGADSVSSTNSGKKVAWWKMKKSKLAYFSPKARRERSKTYDLGSDRLSNSTGDLPEAHVQSSPSSPAKRTLFQRSSSFLKSN